MGWGQSGLRPISSPLIHNVILLSQVVYSFADLIGVGSENSLRK